MPSYSDKLKDPRWQKRRLHVFERDEWKCRGCGRSDQTLHVHHEIYNGEPWEAEDEDLVTLCEICHALVSEFKFAEKGVRKSRNFDGRKLRIIDIAQLISETNYEDCDEVWKFRLKIWVAIVRWMDTQTEKQECPRET